MLHFLIGFFLFIKFCALGFSTSFPHTFETYTCDMKLNEGIERAVRISIGAGRRPIIACDIDDTLTQECVPMRSSGVHHLPTKFSARFEKSSALLEAHAVMAVTSRSMRFDPAISLSHLKQHCPVFHARITSEINFGGDPIHRRPMRSDILYKDGLLIMGESGKTKRQALETYFATNPLAAGEYDIIFIDDNLAWFDAFCSGFRNSQVAFVHLFHIDFPACEGELLRVPMRASGVVSQSPEFDRPTKRATVFHSVEETKEEKDAE